MTINQALRTMCAHNAPGQALVPGVTTECRQCGAPLRPTAGSGNIAVQGNVDAVYPGDGAAADATWADSQ